jgi:SAM-dependent methyltransferase
MSLQASTDNRAGVLYGQQVHPRNRQLADSGVEMVCDTHRSQLAAIGVDPRRVRELSVLECGGTGRDALGWIRLGAKHVTHVDLSVDNVQRLREFAADAGISNITVLHGDLLEIDLPAASFDIVRSRGVWHHLADPAHGLARYARWCRPSGLIHVNAYRAGTYYYYGVKLLRLLAPLINSSQMIAAMEAEAVPPNRVGGLLDDFFVPFMHTASAAVVEHDFARAGLTPLWPHRRGWPPIDHEVRYPDLPEKDEHIQYWLRKDMHHEDASALSRILQYHSGGDDIMLGRTLAYAQRSWDAFERFNAKARAASDSMALARSLARLYLLHHYEISIMPMAGAERHRRLADGFDIEAAAL